MDIGICLNDANIFFLLSRGQGTDNTICKVATILRAKRDNTED